MPCVKLRFKEYRRLDALRVTDKGKLPFNSIVSFLINYYVKGKK
jgi:hypothetical protein